MSSNRLIHSNSPYLLQHAHNPVDWYEWRNDALEKAIREDKPILVSIGYSSCHWCHVMERESFENKDIAEIMNEYFVCIKVDREERPDIDHIYMDAVQAMNVNGGWPLNVFLTPDQKPFYGGTYFPPANWSQLLLQISKAFAQRRKEIDESANDLKDHLQTTDLQRFAKDPDTITFSKASLQKMTGVLSEKFDKQFGGIDKAPKFVMPSVWQFLIRVYSIEKNPQVLEMINLTLEQIAFGGIYDQLGGGFARYSVDNRWFAPHFEKMLYDNAQLLSLYSESYRISQSEIYKNVISETIMWLQQEMMNADGGYYSALDADSEGEEGKFYTWTYDELKSIVSTQTIQFFNATAKGNWEHGRNILIRTENSQPFDGLEREKKKLLEARNQRVRPGLDDKILTGWNAMTINGLTDAYKAFGDESFLNLALKNISFLESKVIHNGRVYRSYKTTTSPTEGFLEDYSFLIHAYLALYQVTFNEEWISKATTWTTYVLEHFYDSADGYFHFSSSSAEQLIARKKEVFDNVIPASNSVMARNLYHLGVLKDHDEWKKIATDMVAKLSSIIESEPVYMSNWAVLRAEITAGLAEIVIVGERAEEMRKDLHKNSLPLSLTMGTTSTSNLPLFEGRNAAKGKTIIYVCFNKTCKLPVETVHEALVQLQN